MTQMPVPDDRYMSGIYYDATVGEFYQFERDEDENDVRLFRPDGEYVESLSHEEFVELQPDLFPVPEEAVENPVEYFEDWVRRHYAHAEMDVGFQFADMYTTVEEVEDDA